MCFINLLSVYVLWIQYVNYLDFELQTTVKPHYCCACGSSSSSPLVSLGLICYKTIFSYDSLIQHLKGQSFF